MAVGLFGLSALFGRWVALPAPLIALGRTVFSCLTLALLVAIRKDPVRLKKRAHYVPLLGSGVLLAAHWTAFFRAVQTGSVAIATLTFATFPLMTALTEPLLFREAFPARSLLAALGALARVGGISWPLGTYFSGSSVLWGLSSAASFAALSLLNRGGARQYPSRVVALYQHASAALCLLPVLCLTQVTPTVTDIGLLLLLGLCCTALAHTLYIQSLSRLTATTAGLVACLEPVYAMMFAWVLLGEALTWRGALSAALILGSTTLAARPKNDDEVSDTDTVPSERCASGKALPKTRCENR